MHSLATLMPLGSLFERREGISITSTCSGLGLAAQVPSARLVVVERSASMVGSHSSHMLIILRYPVLGGGQCLSERCPKLWLAQEDVLLADQIEKVGLLELFQYPLA